MPDLIPDLLLPDPAGELAVAYAAAWLIWFRGWVQRWLWDDERQCLRVNPDADRRWSDSQHTASVEGELLGCFAASALWPLGLIWMSSSRILRLTGERGGGLFRPRGVGAQRSRKRAQHARCLTKTAELEEWLSSHEEVSA